MFDLSTLSISLSDGSLVHLLLVKDHFTKYNWGTLVQSKEHDDVCAYLLDLFRREGTPERWHADNGSEFKNKYVDSVRDQLSQNNESLQLLPYTHSLPRNPACQGLVERGNRTVKSKLISEEIRRLA